MISRIKDDMSRRENTIRDKVPMHNSTWWSNLSEYVNLSDKQTKGELLRSTLFSGGRLNCPQSIYVDSLEAKAKDVEKNIILTDNEIGHNSEGYCTFLEVDWKDQHKIPTEQNIEQFTRFCQNVMMSKYPQAESFEALVMSNFPHIKTKDDVDYICVGYHIIFKHIKTKTQDNLLIAQYIDNNASVTLPMWASKIDLMPYHSAYANLRPIFSHKMLPCPTCLLKSKVGGKGNRKRKSEFDDNLLNGAKKSNRNLTYVEQLLSCSSCFNGKIIDSNYYDLKYILKHNESWEVVDSKQYTISERIKMTSIVSDHPQHFTELLKSDDLGDILDARSNNIITEKESSFARTTKNQFPLDVDDNEIAVPILAKLIRRFIAQFNIYYASSVPDKIIKCSENTVQYKLKIRCKGKGSRFCFVQKREHASNNVYFILNRDGYLSFHCYDNDCKPQLAQNKITMKLTSQEIKDCKTFYQFGVTVIKSQKETEECEQKFKSAKKWNALEMLPKETASLHDMEQIVLELQNSRG